MYFPLNRTLRGAALLLMLASLPGCSLLRSAQPAPTGLQPLPPASLGGSRGARQIVHAAFGEREATLQCVFTVDPQMLRVIGLSPLGERLFSLSFDGRSATVERSPLLPVEIPPERLLNDLQLAYWPLAALQAAMAGSAWQVSEPQPGTRRLRRDGRLVAEVHYGSADPWQGRYWLSNFEFGYALAVDAQPLQ